MATRTITHFKVGAALFNDILGLLFELPARSSRELLNRVESKTGGECEPIFKIDLKPTRKEKPTKRRVRNPPARKKKASKKVARKKIGA